MDYKQKNMKRQELKVWDRILLTKIPKSDIKDYEKNHPNLDMDDFSTADILDKIIKNNPVVMIDNIDEYWIPWFNANIKTNWEIQYHTLAIIDDDSWEYFWNNKKFLKKYRKLWQNIISNMKLSLTSQKKFMMKDRSLKKNIKN